MGSLIEFILDNMFFVVIILFSLFSTLTGKKGKEADETTRHPSQPRHTPVEMEPQSQPRKQMMGQSLREIMEQMEKQINDSLESPEEKKVKEAHSKEVLRQEQLKRELERQKQLQPSSRPERGETVAPVAVTKSPIYANDLTKSKTLSFDKESVTTGIIYSEILSKPRALNPYQRGVKK